MKEEVSRTDICVNKCKNKCCKSTPPSLISEDYTRISKLTNKSNWYSKMYKKNIEYKVVSKKEKSNDCIFLTKKGFCEVYGDHPLDCKLFPILFKIKKNNSNSYSIKWLLWYCPLIETIGIKQMKEEAKKLIEGYLISDPDLLFEYQSSMYASGGYKKKHFLEEEHILISES